MTVDDDRILNRSLWRDVVKNIISAAAVAALFYFAVAVLGFRFPKGANVPVGAAT